MVGTARCVEDSAVFKRKSNEEWERENTSKKGIGQWKEQNNVRKTLKN